MVSFKGISKEIADAKDLLKETIDQAEEEKKNYPEHLVEAIRVLFEQALEDAWAAYNNPNATLDEIREADDTLIEIMQYLTTPQTRAVWRKRLHGPRRLWIPANTSMTTTCRPTSI